MFNDDDSKEQDFCFTAPLLGLLYLDCLGKDRGFPARVDRHTLWNKESKLMLIS